MPPIRLVRIDDALCRAVETSPEACAERFGLSLGENAPAIRQVLAQTRALLDRVPRGPEWGGFLVVDVKQALVVGTCGFTHGPEADGTVEIAYFTFPQFERRGYATAMARELLDRALRSRDVRGVVAHTLPEPNASTRILERIGMRQVGEAEDEDAGCVWRWEYRPRA